VLLGRIMRSSLVTAEMTVKTKLEGADTTDHTVDKQVLLAPDGKHYVNENGVLHQPARTKWQALLNHHYIGCSTCLDRLLFVQGW